MERRRDLDASESHHQLRSKITAYRGSENPCPVYGKMCKARDFQEKPWLRLNFFLHHCYITAKVPRIRCPEHGIKTVRSLAPDAVNPNIKLIGMTDKSLWRIIIYHIERMSGLDMGFIQAVAMDEIGTGRWHPYVTVLINLDNSLRIRIGEKYFKGHAGLHANQAFL